MSAGEEMAPHLFTTAGPGDPGGGSNGRGKQLPGNTINIVSTNILNPLVDKANGGGRGGACADPVVA